MIDRTPGCRSGDLIIQKGRPKSLSLILNEGEKLEVYPTQFMVQERFKTVEDVEEFEKDSTFRIRVDDVLSKNLVKAATALPKFKIFKNETETTDFLKEQVFRKANLSKAFSRFGSKFGAFLDDLANLPKHSPMYRYVSDKVVSKSNLTDPHEDIEKLKEVSRNWGPDWAQVVVSSWKQNEAVKGQSVLARLNSNKATSELSGFKGFLLKILGGSSHTVQESNSDQKKTRNVTFAPEPAVVKFKVDHGRKMTPTPKR